MKIETEVDHSLYAFTSAEGKSGGGVGTGCSVNGGGLPPIAQDSERSSIDRPERQLTPPGCGGCGSSGTGENNTNGDVSLTSVFDCEHFQFIDEEEEFLEDDVPATETSTGEAPANGDTPAFVNGTNGVPPPRHCATSGSHLSSEQKDSDLCSGDNPVEVSNQLPQHSRETDMSDSEASARSKGHAVKRQVSFDDAAADGSREPNSTTKELRSLLKKSSKCSNRQKGRVTFDEAVTLYSDESEDVQLIPLTTGPEIVCTEVFYMFEPPIEYQDVPPFEPPAEYRDPDEMPAPEMRVPVENVDQPAQNDSDSYELTNGVANDNCSTEMVITDVLDAKVAELSSTVDDRSDVAVSLETENIDSAADQTKNDSIDSNQLQTESSEESDKLFERFLEAEREFAVDEELNSVFHELDSDFSNDARNGAFDDNFFRKLISLLSSAEGEGSVEDGDIFSSTKFANSSEDADREMEDDDNSQTHSRTLSEADSDCSISSQDTIIVRLGDEENEQNSNDLNDNFPDKAKEIEAPEVSTDNCDAVLSEKKENYDEVFRENSDNLSSNEKPRPLPRESLLLKNAQVVSTKIDKVNEESLSRQSSGEQSVNSGNSQDPPQDADDSTSSDSRSGEVEEEIRLDDIGYDEEDADDYDEESFRGMAHGNSKIRRIIKKNALQCSLFRGIEAKRRQQPGAKYPRPKSPLLSQESLVEKLKWLTTIDEHKDVDAPLNFHSKPPDVILSTGGVPVNGSMGHSASSEDDIGNQSLNYQHPQFYQMQPRLVLPHNSKGGYYVRHDAYPPTHPPSLPRQRMAFSGHSPQIMPHTSPYPPNRMVSHPSTSQVQWPEHRPMTSMTVPRNFRDWRVIQRVMVNRSGDSSSRPSQVPADYVRCPNGGVSAYPVNVLPDVSRATPTSGNKDELEKFVEQDSKRIERIRKRYSVAEEEDDPTFGFARRPSVRGVQSQIQSNPSETIQGHGTNKVDPYTVFEETAQGPPLHHPRPTSYSADQSRVWNRDPKWRPENISQSQLYGPSQQTGRPQVPMHIHRASVALTELPGSATIPYTHRKPHSDTRYHSYAESMYGSTRTLPTKGWMPPDSRICHNVPAPAAAHQTLQITTVPLPAVSPPMLQVPPHPIASKDERGVPEGASSSPKISSDSLYHAPVPDTIATGGSRKEDGVIYYSLNV
ncbi:hypothetical protein X975_23377, partial [Stegodyphus mimosarum]